MLQRSLTTRVGRATPPDSRRLTFGAVSVLIAHGSVSPATPALVNIDQVGTTADFSDRIQTVEIVPNSCSQIASLLHGGRHP
jgi:hypothetical protein